MSCLFYGFSSLDKTNKESVRAIQKSIFTVCLDAPMPQVSDGLYQSRVAAQMLHGGGARWNSGNRWFDKTLQVSSRQPQFRTLTDFRSWTEILFNISQCH